MQRRAGHNATLTTQQSNQEEEEHTVLTLELRPRRRIRWDNNVVDNERMNRKKSKSTCCVSFRVSSIHTTYNNTNQNAEYFTRRSHLVRVHQKRIVLQMNQLRVMMNGSIGIVAVVVVLVVVEVVTIRLVIIKMASAILVNKM